MKHRALVAVVAALVLISLAPAPRAGSRPSGDAAVSVIVREAVGAAGAASRVVAELGGEVTTELPIIGGFAAGIPAHRLPELEGHPAVLSVAPNLTLSPQGYDDEFDAEDHAGSLHNVADYIDVDDVWDEDVTGAGVDVALIDSGVSPVEGLSGANKVVHGPDLSFDSQSDNLRHLDAFGHGTHMAGIIAGRDADITDDYDDASEDHFVGIAPEARIVNVKVGDAQGVTDVSQVIAAIDWVVQHRNSDGLNIRVLNLSYGTDGLQDYQLDPLAFAAEQAWDAGIVVVVAAGNDGGNTPLRNPARDPFTIAVGALDTNGSRGSYDDYVASFSSCGTSDRHVDVLAPGRSIVSLRTPGSYADLENPNAVQGDRFFAGSGTSQAAAVVSGSVALLLDHRPNLTPDEVKGLLMDTADSVSGAPSHCQGAGLIDVEDAFEDVDDEDYAPQLYARSTGLGSLDAARGSDRLTMDDIELDDEEDIFGNYWDPATWTVQSKTETSWDDGIWNSSVWTGGSWSGGSWSGGSWSGGSWSGGSWSGGSWSGGSWSGGSWSGGSWSGGSWSGGTWSGGSWSGKVWLTDSWR